MSPWDVPFTCPNLMFERRKLKIFILMVFYFMCTSLKFKLLIIQIKHLVTRTSSLRDSTVLAKMFTPTLAFAHDDQGPLLSVHIQTLSIAIHVHVGVKAHLYPYRKGVYKLIVRDQTAPRARLVAHENSTFRTLAIAVSGSFMA